MIGDTWKVNLQRSILPLVGRLDDSGLLAKLAEISPVVVFRAGGDLRISYISSNLTRIWGYSEEEAYRDPNFFLNHIHPEDRETVRKDLLQALEIKRRELKVEARFIRKNGDHRYFSSQIFLEYDEQGNFLHVLGYFMDITEPRLVAETLKTTLEKMEDSRNNVVSILNQLSLGTAITDEKGLVTFLSDTAQQVLEKGPGSFLGKHWSEVFSLGAESEARLEAMSENPDLRTKFPVHIETPAGRHHFIEIDVRDDPRNFHRKIFFLYDTTEVQNLRRLLDEKVQFRDLVGRSKAMRLVYEQIREVSRVDSTVLIEGETGTGKELAARAIHYSSHRNRKPFIAINCAAIQDSLVASQLFGHKRGAFTGAVADQQGLFEAADGGSLFLDEIGDIPTAVQTSLLRVLEDREITRLGESKSRKVNVRFIAATSGNLNELISTGRFRQDLLYRIRIARICLPPLRERREDIPLLVARFLSDIAAASGKVIHEVSRDAMHVLLEYEWPGNVRELKNFIEYAVIRCKEESLQLDDLPPEILAKPARPARVQQNGHNEKEQLIEALALSDGNRSKAARQLGIGRATLYRRMIRHQIPTDKAD